MHTMKVLAIALWVLWFFMLTNNNFVVSVGICRENEQRALESLKKEVDDPSYLLSSWVVGKDCCKWEGVACNNLTHHVIELHMHGQFSYDGSSYPRINSLEWLLSLLSLEYLEMYSVDLSKATNWLQVINMLPSLVDLSLVYCNLNHIQPLLHDNFSSLETLDLSWNNFSSPVPEWVFNLANLVSLHLSGSNFIGQFSQGPVNLTSLTTFKASGNSFNCLLPRWLFDLSNLEHIELTRSGIEGAIPSKCGNITKLKYLDLSENNLNSTIPNWLCRCKGLESIDLSDNMLSGKLPDVIGKLGKLELLDLSLNLFEGEVYDLFNGRSNFVSAEMGNSSSLSYLSLENNKLTGTLP
ncbi:receptor-like protein 53 [Lycium ferocissimum]|uniref:receptor-like protein 53 n=1 Tax=Lycium ferocissimum TaxID=112874 RepID=UPI0028150D1D|nr:receptor-like protein 53 [Lycium ferocissimum]